MKTENAASQQPAARLTRFGLLHPDEPNTGIAFFDRSVIVRELPSIGTSVERGFTDTPDDRESLRHGQPVGGVEIADWADKITAVVGRPASL